jgi:hypothetical protein
MPTERLCPVSTNEAGAQCCHRLRHSELTRDFPSLSIRDCGGEISRATPATHSSR